MQNLFPIIRRKRRPLMVVDTPPVVAGSVEPVKVEAETDSQSNHKPENPDAGESAQGTDF